MLDLVLFIAVIFLLFLLIYKTFSKDITKRKLWVLFEISNKFRSELSLSEILSNCLELIVDSLDDFECGILLTWDENEELKSMNFYHGLFGKVNSINIDSVNLTVIGKIRAAKKDFKLDDISDIFVNEQVVIKSKNFHVVKLVGDVGAFVFCSDNRRIDSSEYAFLRLVVDYFSFGLKSRNLMRKVDRFEKTIDTLEYTYQRIVDNLPVGVVGVDNEKNVVLWNNLMEEMFNIKEIDILDKSIVNIFLTDPNKRTISEFIEKLKKDSSVQEVEEFHYKDSDGNNKVFLVLGYVLREDTARVGGSILVFRDITENFNFEEKLRFAQEIKEQELKSKVNIATRELQNANVELKKLNHLKSEFVSVVSHELRTPLTSIRGYASLLITERLGKLTPQQKESLSIMKEEGERLSNIINDLLDLSKLEAGKTDLHFENGDLAEQLKGVLSALEVQAHSKKIRLSISGKRKLIAQFDKEKMRQVFFNIIGNAIKYTLDSGKVTVSLKEDKTYAIIEVKDTGVGIAKKDIKRIFEPFAQAESHLKRSVPGSGLGLSISKHMIDMHHGEIKVTSKVGKGSVFALYIPKKQELEVKNEHSSKNADISNELRTNSKRKK